MFGRNFSVPAGPQPNFRLSLRIFVQPHSATGSAAMVLASRHQRASGAIKVQDIGLFWDTLAYQQQCIASCPANTFTHQQECVKSCPATTFIHQEKCVASCPINNFIYQQECL